MNLLQEILDELVRHRSFRYLQHDCIEMVALRDVRFASNRQPCRVIPRQVELNFLLIEKIERMHRHGGIDHLLRDHAYCAGAVSKDEKARAVGKSDNAVDQDGFGNAEARPGGDEALIAEERFLRDNCMFIFICDDYFQG